MSSITDEVINPPADSSEFTIYDGEPEIVRIFMSKPERSKGIFTAYYNNGYPTWADAVADIKVFEEYGVKVSHINDFLYKQTVSSECPFVRFYKTHGRRARAEWKRNGNKLPDDEASGSGSHAASNVTASLSNNSLTNQYPPQQTANDTSLNNHPQLAQQQPAYQQSTGQHGYPQHQLLSGTGPYLSSTQGTSNNQQGFSGSGPYYVDADGNPYSYSSNDCNNGTNN